ncbi:hypothetical protein yc1106_06580 [Curvularia clavata]|uniref:MARVEL domain-containing protein n=1 Tax=Curvularia clavata TaxID=95742 RepID=A0A9Q8ZBS1_CURCL|nr:hypothetical protein yc1106_06580 [Curvularia clavata]
MVARIFSPSAQTSHDAGAATQHGRHFFCRIAELATHMLHLISTSVVFGISIYFIHEYQYETIASPFWAALTIMDIFVCFYALFRIMFQPRAGDVALVMFTLAGLWLAALAFATKDYLDSTCPISSYNFDDCDLRRTHIAFSLLAFLTSLFTMVMAIARWRHNSRLTRVDDKASQTSAPVAITTTPFPAQNTPFPAHTTTTLPRKTSLAPQNTPSPAQKSSLGPQNTPFPAT